jgi:hypothetical protein
VFVFKGRYLEPTGLPAPKGERLILCTSDTMSVRDAKHGLGEENHPAESTAVKERLTVSIDIRTVRHEDGRRACGIRGCPRIAASLWATASPRARARARIHEPRQAFGASHRARLRKASWDLFRLRTGTTQLAEALALAIDSRRRARELRTSLRDVAPRSFLKALAMPEFKDLRRRCDELVADTAQRTAELRAELARAHRHERRMLSRLPPMPSVRRPSDCGARNRTAHRTGRSPVVSASKTSGGGGGGDGDPPEPPTQRRRPGQGVAS